MAGDAAARAPQVDRDAAHGLGALQLLQRLDVASRKILDVLRNHTTAILTLGARLVMLVADPHCQYA